MAARPGDAGRRRRTPDAAVPGTGHGIRLPRRALNLAWKLDLVLAGKAPDSLLDTYGEERKPHVAAIIEQAVALGRVVCVRDPGEAAARDAVLLSGGAPLPPPFPTLSGRLFAPDDPLAGTLAPQARVRWGAADGLFDDLRGRGWTVLTFDAFLARRLDHQAAALFDRLGLSVVTLSENGNEAGVSDLTGALPRVLRCRRDRGAGGAPGFPRPWRRRGQRRRGRPAGASRRQLGCRHGTGIGWQPDPARRRRPGDTGLVAAEAVQLLVRSSRGRRASCRPASRLRSAAARPASDGRRPPPARQGSMSTLAGQIAPSLPLR